MKKTKLATLALSAVLAVGTLGVITGCGESGPQDGESAKAQGCEHRGGDR